MKVSIYLRPKTTEGRLVTWLLASMVGGVGNGTIAAVTAWFLLHREKRKCLTVAAMLVAADIFFTQGIYVFRRVGGELAGKQHP